MLFPGQADVTHCAELESRAVPFLRPLSQTSRAKFGQSRKARQRDEVKHVQHSVPFSTPAREKPAPWHALMQFSTLLLDGPPSTFPTTLRSRWLASATSLFAKRTHPSDVTGPLPNKKAKCICLRDASHEFEIARDLNNGRLSPWRRLRRGGGRGYKL
jgi:hypothetical protein